MTDDITTATRRLVDEVHNKGQVDVLGEILGAGLRRQRPCAPEPIRGADGKRQLVTAYRNAFPALEVTVDDMIAARIVEAWKQLGHARIPPATRRHPDREPT
jgi:hypothetical protein